MKDKKKDYDNQFCSGYPSNDSTMSFFTAFDSGFSARRKPLSVLNSWRHIGQVLYPLVAVSVVLIKINQMIFKFKQN